MSTPVTPSILLRSPFITCTVLFPRGTTSAGSGIAPNWGTWNFSDGTVGEFYDHEWDMPHADRPITYSVVSGSLPPGLSLVSIDGHSAKVTGTPTTAGTYSFTLRASNSVGTADISLSITISASSGGEASHTFVC